MNRCPITYEVCGNKNYSPKGLHLLSSRLQNLKEFLFGKNAQLELAFEYADKLSFSGVQGKLNARLSASEQVFKIVPKAGTFIIKPQSPNFSELPENEDLTMKLAKVLGIVTPFHGLMLCKDGSFSYFIKRFDRRGRGEKLGVNDFAQLSGLSRETKYDSSMEKVASLVEEFCTFPAMEKQKLFLLAVFSFLVGNEDLHLKNLSLLQVGPIVELSPAYDLVNSSIVMNTKEEMALPLNGKKSGLTRSDLVEYYGKTRLGLSMQTIEEVLLRIQNSMKQWKALIAVSFLSEQKKKAYLELLDERIRRLFTTPPGN